MDKIASYLEKFEFFNPINDEEVQFRCLVSNEWIYGLLNVPRSDKEANFPFIILLHDWSGNRQGPHRIFVKLARLLVRNGNGVVRFDFRGRGESTGKTDSTTYQTMMEDVAAVHRMVIQAFNPIHIYLLGFCSGGMLALRYLLYYPGISGTILLSPMPAEKTENKYQSIEFATRPFTSKSLIIFGGNDPDYKISYTYYSRIFDRLNIPFQVKIIKRANHGFFSLKWEKEIYSLIDQWFKKF